MNKKNIYIIRKILMLSFPILLGYIPLGMTFGILANKIQIGLPLTAAMSFLCFTGAGQFMLLSLLAVGTNFVEIFIISYLVNLRHSFYIISLWKDQSVYIVEDKGGARREIFDLKLKATDEELKKAAKGSPLATFKKKSK